LIWFRRVAGEWEGRRGERVVYRNSREPFRPVASGSVDDFEEGSRAEFDSAPGTGGSAMRLRRARSAGFREIQVESWL